MGNRTDSNDKDRNMAAKGKTVTKAREGREQTAEGRREERKKNQTPGEREDGAMIQQEMDFGQGENPEDKSLREQEAVAEAVLFTMGKSVEIRQLAAALECDGKTARAAALRLKERYDQGKRGIQIIELEDSFQMCTRAEFYDSLIRVAATPKKQVLTDVALETLSIIAYKQPVTKLEIEKIRGVKSDHAVNRLIEYNMVYEVGRLDAPGRPALFATTEEFLRRFGVGSAQDLPTMNPERMEEIKAEVEEELQLKLEELPDGEENRSSPTENYEGEDRLEAVEEKRLGAERSGDEERREGMDQAAAALEEE